jgi:nitric oxide reductase NorD protein
MSWDEALFGAVYEGTKRWWRTRAPAELLARRVELEPHRLRLRALAQLLSGDPVELVLTDEVGGWRGDVIVLPRAFEAAPTPELNLAAAVARVVFTCASRRLGHVLPPGLDALGEVVATSLAAAQTTRAMLEDSPAFAEPWAVLEGLALAGRSSALEALVREKAGSTDSLLAQTRAVLARLPRPARRFGGPAPAPAASWLWGTLLPASPRRADGVSAAVDDAVALPGGTERRRHLAKHVERINEPNNQLAENPLVHSFEKVHTLEEYKGGSKRIDGDDELAAHAKALDELDLRHVVRSHQRARSVYQADVMLDGSVGELDDAVAAPAEALYDEWDEAAGRWRRDWCRLTTRAVPLLGRAEADVRELRTRLVKTTVALRAVFEQVEASRAWRLRQLEGPDVDVDALVARYGALHAGHSGDARLYAARRRHSRDTAVLVLLDVSLSTDAWVLNRRVLDVEKEAVIALGDALEGLFDQVAVAAFCSQTRRDCRFFLAKGFADDWREGARRVASLEPAGFTRIGPALRHATKLLGACGARKKLLVLVSDGKPSDVDRYEGRYGVADIRHAVREADVAGVTIHALAVDPAARAWLPQMFGHGRADVVDRTDRLVAAMARVTAALLR